MSIRHKLRLLVMIGVSLLPGANTSAQNGSIYTELSPRICAPLVSSGEPEDNGGIRCRAPDGYQLLVHYGDSRESVSVVTPKEKTFDLNLWSSSLPRFSTIGRRVEWRVSAQHQRIPLALIIRTIIVTNTSGRRAATSYLIVAKITSDLICVTDRIPPGRLQSQNARVAADEAQAKPCLGFQY